jgi:hypothetical protein
MNRCQNLAVKSMVIMLYVCQYKLNVRYIIMLRNVQTRPCTMP